MKSLEILPYIYVEICGIGWVQIFFHWITKSVRQLFFGFVWSSTSKKDHLVMWWYFLPNNWQLIWQKIDIQFATVYWIFFTMHITQHLPICWVELKSIEVEVDHILNPFFSGMGYITWKESKIFYEFVDDLTFLVWDTALLKVIINKSCSEVFQTYFFAHANI